MQSVARGTQQIQQSAAKAMMIVMVAKLVWISQPIVTPLAPFQSVDAQHVGHLIH